MAHWVIVGDHGDGVPRVVMSWVMEAGGTTMPIETVKRSQLEPAIFPSRWAAKRVLRKRDAWRSWRLIRRERL